MKLGNVMECRGCGARNKLLDGQDVIRCSYCGGFLEREYLTIGASKLKEDLSSEFNEEEREEMMEVIINDPLIRSVFMPKKSPIYIQFCNAFGFRGIAYLTIILALAFCFASCKKTTTNNSTAHTAPPNTTSTSDSVWVNAKIEAPVGGSFNYRYDTVNTRILLNGHRLSNSQWYINYEHLNLSNINLSLDVMGYCNFTSTPKYLHMNSHDTLTFIIDSLYYTNTNPVTRGGSILIGVNMKPTATNNTVNVKIYTSANNLDTVTYLPVGRAMGNAATNGQGGTTQSFYWYLGTKFVYKWIKP